MFAMDSRCPENYWRTLWCVYITLRWRHLYPEAEKRKSRTSTYELAEKIRLGVFTLCIPKDRSAEDGFMTVSVGAACLTPASC